MTHQYAIQRRALVQSYQCLLNLGVEIHQPDPQSYHMQWFWGRCKADKISQIIALGAIVFLLLCVVPAQTSAHHRVYAEPQLNISCNDSGGHPTINQLADYDGV
uniref:Uncharacterized protein n=1 Tax=Eutreptiella gymnastica TaxID=73025 RepID=A0A7S4LGS9_9EUGL